MEVVQNKKLKNVQEKEDRISSLPDSLIHHILSFLPSTKEAIQTGVLSKRWAKQWTRVPVLIFDRRATPFENCSRCIDNTLILYYCSKIKKFHVSNPETDSQLTAQVRFATMKCVEELILDVAGSYGKYRLPNFLFSYSSLVKLETLFGRFVPNAKVHWGSLKDLKLLFCELTEDAIKNVLSGSPALESLELGECGGYDKLVVASESLKKLVVSSFCIPVIEISCSNLVELKLQILKLKDLKMRVPCLIRATLFIGCKYVNYIGEGFEEYQSMVKNILGILGSISNVKELTLGSGVNEVLSTLSMGAQHSPLHNCKRLTLDVNIYDLPFGIAFVLRHSPVLENLFVECDVAPHPVDLNATGENWWNSNETIFDCVVSHLKTVTISGLAGSDSTYKLVLHFIEFILKNARVLEKLEVILNDKDTNFVIEVSNKLLNSPKCSQHAIVRLHCR